MFWLFLSSFRPKACKNLTADLFFLVDVSDVFYFLFRGWGTGRRSPRQVGGGFAFVENEGGVLSQGEVGGGGSIGAGRVGMSLCSGHSTTALFVRRRCSDSHKDYI